MALSKSVEDSLKESQQSLRNALSFAARTERPMVCTAIVKMISSIDNVIDTDSILEQLENRQEGLSGTWGTFFNDDD